MAWVGGRRSGCGGAPMARIGGWRSGSGRALLSEAPGPCTQLGSAGGGATARGAGEAEGRADAASGARAATTRAISKHWLCTTLSACMLLLVPVQVLPASTVTGAAATRARFCAAVSAEEVGFRFFLGTRPPTGTPAGTPAASLRLRLFSGLFRESRTRSFTAAVLLSLRVSLPALRTFPSLN